MILSVHLLCILQGIQTQISDEMERSATDDEVEIKSHILFMPGPFTTCRAVYKSIRFSKRTVAKQKFQEIVRDLEDKGLGKHIELNKSESAYYKPLPSTDIQATLKPHLGKSTVLPSRTSSQRKWYLPPSSSVCLDIIPKKINWRIRAFKQVLLAKITTASCYMYHDIITPYNNIIITQLHFIHTNTIIHHFSSL